MWFLALIPKCPFSLHYSLITYITIMGEDSKKVHKQNASVLYNKKTKPSILCQRTDSYLKNHVFFVKKTASDLGEIFANFPDIKKEPSHKKRLFYVNQQIASIASLKIFSVQHSKNSLTGPCSTYTYIISRLCYIVLYIFTRSFTTNTSINSLINTQLYYGRIHDFISAHTLKTTHSLSAVPKKMWFLIFIPLSQVAFI